LAVAAQKRRPPMEAKQLTGAQLIRKLWVTRGGRRGRPSDSSKRTLTAGERERRRYLEIQGDAARFVEALGDLEAEQDAPYWPVALRLAADSLERRRRRPRNYESHPELAEQGEADSEMPMKGCYKARGVAEE
jgi:hypothetical protein